MCESIEGAALSVRCPLGWRAIGMTALLTWVSPSGEHEMYMYALTLKTIDDFLIIPGANGCVVTGLLYSLFTPWGVFKHRWVALKWVFTLFMMASGTFLMGPCVNGNVYPPERLADYAVNADAYWDNISQTIFWGIIQVVCLLLVVVVSVCKPWKKTIKTERKTN